MARKNQTQIWIQKTKGRQNFETEGAIVVETVNEEEEGRKIRR